jgi:GNAT superfamily N-acetyltransferase
MHDVEIAAMGEDFLVWRCLHFGPLTCETIDDWPQDGQIDFERYRKRNLPLLEKLTRAYGACAILAKAGDRIVSQLRFYPKALWSLKNAGELCLLQDFPSGPKDDFGSEKLPPFSELEDKTLVIHCLMTGTELQETNPYQRRGIGSRMVRYLIDWAKTRGWERIEVDAFEDVPLIYEITGSAGINFWRKLGFRIIDRHPHPYLQDRSDFVLKLEEQARAAGISPVKAKDRIVMRLDLI